MEKKTRSARLRKQVLSGILVAFSGYALGYSLLDSAPPRAPELAAQSAAAFARYNVPVGESPVRGPSTARVTIVEYLDYQCSHCAAANATLANLQRKYPNDVRLVVKHLPLAANEHSRKAASAAIAAHLHGKFWDLHDRLLLGQSSLDEGSIRKIAASALLDVQKLESDMGSEKVGRLLADDLALAKKVGARGTPFYFINGRPLRGNKPLAELSALVDAEVEGAKKLEATGIAPSAVYEHLMANATEAVPPAPPVYDPHTKSPGKGDTYRVSVVGSPTKGPDSALVTIVQFSDFECYYCATVDRTLEEILRKYGDRVRLVWRDLPMPFHRHGFLAALYARAAARQNKFWEMHDALVQRLGRMEPKEVYATVAALKMDVERFRADVESQRDREAIERDMKEAAHFGVRGVPAFFINGRYVAGARSSAEFSDLVEEELGRAEHLVRRGTPPRGVYDALMAQAKPHL
jgi:protein-disulfide isomerase